MTRPRSLAEWLSWQESLSPRTIVLGLDRVREVASRLALRAPPDGVFSVAGTNGKGSTVSFLEQIMLASRRSCGVYTSPHLLRYNERVRVDGKAVSDMELIAAFEAVEAARGDVPLTYFEFGTLAALVVFCSSGCGIWILEVGLGGRLDAVNGVDPDYSLITTIALDHQDWLGDDLDSIAAEKAGIMRPGKPAFFGDLDCPEPIARQARETGAQLHLFGRDFGCERGRGTWFWHGDALTLADLPEPSLADAAQLRNVSLALAAAEMHDPALLAPAAVAAALRADPPAGRFQIVAREQEWVLDVAHNPQAARLLARRVRARPEVPATTAVIGMLETKDAEAVISEMDLPIDRWVACSMPVPRALGAADLSRQLARADGAQVDSCATPDAGFELARKITAPGGRILVFGSFHMVGPALRWLGLY